MIVLISLIVGLIGGNVAALLVKKLDLGLLWNSVAGFLGGGIGYFILNLLGVSVVGYSFLWSIIASIIGAIVLLYVARMIIKAT